MAAGTGESKILLIHSIRTDAYIMAELHYNKETFTADLNMDFKVTDNFTLKTGYQYENNSNYVNHKISTGIFYILG